MSKKKPIMEKEITIKSLFGNQIVPQEIVLAGMKNLENELDRQFKRKQEQRELADKQSKVLRESLLFAIGNSKEHAEALKALKEMSMNRDKTRAVSPEMPVHKQRIFTGSIGAVVTPPFDYQWRWGARSGTVDIIDIEADNNKGTLRIDIGSENNCTCSARTAVGIFFRPVTEFGTLAVWAIPAFGFDWYDWGTFASAHSDAFLGLYVGSYDLNGEFAGTVVSQQHSLWSDSSSLGSGGDSGSSPGSALLSAFPVNSNHWYALWVWCGANIHADGWGESSASSASAILSVTVPSITWELF